MPRIVKALAATAIATTLTFAAPLAVAEDAAPPGLSSRGSSQDYITRDSSRWNDGPFSHTRIKESRNSQLNRASPSRRGSALIRQGIKAERNGDNEKACSYYTRARQAFSDANSSAGMNQSDILMERTCTAQSS